MNKQELTQYAVDVLGYSQDEAQAIQENDLTPAQLYYCRLYNTSDTQVEYNYKNK